MSLVSVTKCLKNVKVTMFYLNHLQQHCAQSANFCRLLHRYSTFVIVRNLSTGSLWSCWNHYKLLGVAENATKKEIKAAYIKLAQRYHPDKNPGNKSVHEKFVNIKNAYETLGTESSRAIYDRSLHGTRPDGIVYNRARYRGSPNNHARRKYERDMDQQFAEAYAREIYRQYQSKMDRDPLREHWDHIYKERRKRPNQTSNAPWPFNQTKVNRFDIMFLAGVGIASILLINNKVQSTKELRQRMALRDQMSKQREAKAKNATITSTEEGATPGNKLTSLSKITPVDILEPVEDVTPSDKIKPSDNIIISFENITPIDSIVQRDNITPDINITTVENETPHDDFIIPIDDIITPLDIITPDKSVKPVEKINIDDILLTPIEILPPVYNLPQVDNVSSVEEMPQQYPLNE